MQLCVSVVVRGSGNDTRRDYNENPPHDLAIFELPYIDQKHPFLLYRLFIKLITETESATYSTFQLSTSSNLTRFTTDFPFACKVLILQVL